jgi:Tfp pilus assembly protein PilZ
MQERGAVRITPRAAITVVIEDEGYGQAYGVVANISEAGACVWTNGRFSIGDNLVVRLSFVREPQPFQTSGQVVWGDPTPERDTATRYGLKWAPVPAPEHERLRSLISASA